MYSTDLQLEIPAGVSHRVYADDVKIFADISRPDGRLALQQTLSNIEAWAKRWRLNVSTSKSATLHVLHDNRHGYKLFDETVPEPDRVRDLGILLSCDLSPEAHISEALSRANRTSNFVLRAFDCKLPHVYMKAYNALVLPALLYAVEVWRPWLSRHKASLERLQRRFVRRVALKCDTDPGTISVRSLEEILDARDLNLYKLIRRCPDLVGFFCHAAHKYPVWCDT